jgi:hypothetical protein
MCFPTDGPDPALVTNERRPLASVIGPPSAVRTGSRPSMYRLSPVDEVGSSTVSVHSVATGAFSRWRRYASRPMNGASFTRGRCMSASTRSNSSSSSLPWAR